LDYSTIKITVQKESIKTFAEALNPRRLIPVHTEYAHEFKKHFDNVTELEDGAALSI
jgi:mRNA degradation ribonuclease J1/J2